MRDPIAWFTGWVSALLTPRTPGRHSRAHLVTDPAEPQHVTQAVPRTSARRRAVPHAEPIDGEATAMVRPYVLAAEQKQRRAEQRQRRRELALALLGQDTGPRWIHGIEVA